MNNNNEGKEGKFSFDELDNKIVHLMQQNSRESFRKLASKLGVAPATLIERVRRLEKAGVIIGYGVAVDYSKLGYSFSAIVEVTARKGAVLEVQKKIACMNGVVSVYDVTGQTDSIVFARCRSRDEFSKLVKKILAIEN